MRYILTCLLTTISWPVMCQVRPVIASHKVFSHYLEPATYPDAKRYHVLGPSWKTFGNQPGFTVLRRFPMVNNQLVDCEQEIDRYTKQFALGNVIWPNSAFLPAGNLGDLVSSIKNRGLFLYEIWGYVPGSGPGTWHQFTMDPKTARLFEEQLGDHWLGMDMGEQDGRYLLAYARQLFPNSVHRPGQYLNFHRHMQRISDDSGNKMAGLTAVTYAHYMAKEGIYTMIGSEAAQMHPNGQVFYAFNRGAGKQYGVPWFGNASVFNRWGWKDYNRQGANSSPLKGASLALMNRLIYSHILYNCMVVGFESGWLKGEQLTPVGTIQQSAVRWTKEHGLPGVMQTPVALLNDFFSGWVFPNYNNIIYKTWGNLAYQPGDYLTNNIFDMLYPGYQNSSFFRDEAGFTSPTPYGDIADALLSDAPGWLLKRYPLLIVAGELKGGAEIQQKLQDYVQQGGHLVITAGSLKNLKGGLAGFAVTSNIKMLPAQTTVTVNQIKIKEQQSLQYYPIQIPDKASISASAKGVALAVNQKLGKGTVTLLASPFGVGNVAQAQVPKVQGENQPLPNPYPMLAHVRAILDSALRSVQLFDAGKDLSVITCRKQAGEYTVGISNETWSAKPFNLISNLGPIVSVTELPIDASLKDFPEYLPEDLQQTTKFRANSKEMIDGGDIRIFRVKVKETGVVELPNDTGKPLSGKRLLAIRNFPNLQNEILLRPSFFQHFNGVSVDADYVTSREATSFASDSLWPALQKLNIVVDLSSKINLFPGIRLVNNIRKDYEQSMHTIQSTISKMPLIGSGNLIISLHGKIENNISAESTASQIDSTLHVICRLAAQKNLTVHLRLTSNKLSSTPKEAAILLERLNEPNLRLAVSTAQLLDDRASLSENLSLLKKHIGIWSVSSPVYDLQGTLISLYGHLLQEHVLQFREMIAAAPHVPVIVDAPCEDQDQEFENALVLEQILNEL